MKNDKRVEDEQKEEVGIGKWDWGKRCFLTSVNTLLMEQ